MAVSPGMCDDKHGFQFPNAHSRAFKDAGNPDPCPALLLALQGAPSTEQVRDILHIQGLFDGFKTEDAVRDTVTKWLSEITDDARSHRVVAADPSFPLRLLAPSVIVKAV